MAPVKVAALISLYHCLMPEMTLRKLIFWKFYLSQEAAWRKNHTSSGKRENRHLNCLDSNDRLERWRDRGVSSKLERRVHVVHGIWTWVVAVAAWQLLENARETGYCNELYYKLRLQRKTSFVPHFRSYSSHQPYVAWNSSSWNDGWKNLLPNWKFIYLLFY